jgi:hypothetical protein
MTVPSPPRRTLLLAAPALLAACAADPAPPAAAPEASVQPAAPDARIELINWRLGAVGIASWGRGVLIRDGERHPFRLRAVGAGGVGVARVRASGEIYNLRRLEDFPGTYGKLRAGTAVPGADVPGALWMVNARGVQMLLSPQQAGLALHVGVDAVLIEMLPGTA